MKFPEDYTPLTIIADLEGALDEKSRPDGEGLIQVIGGMPKGTRAGKASIGMIVLDKATGRRLYCETTLKLFLAAAQVLRERYKDELED